MAQDTLTPQAAGELDLFRASLPQRICCQEILRAIGEVDGLACLDVALGSGAISRFLRKHGGKWSTAVADRDSLETVRSLVGDSVEAIGEGNALPFKKKTFDIVVLGPYLEKVSEDLAFVEECHKLLKPDGRLILVVSRQKPFSMMTPIRSLLGLTSVRLNPVRSGYTESQLFNILKHGFDVVGVRSYSRFFVEFIDAIVRSVSLRMERGEAPGVAMRKRLRVYGVARPFYWVADQMDLALFLTRGHYMIAVAKRRAWRPRNAPILVDGRSISEAVLSRPSD